MTSRFDEYGCSKRFELIDVVDGTHVLIRCKSCGNEFTRNTTFLNKSKNHGIECVRCGMHANGKITPPRSECKKKFDESLVIEYYMAGNSVEQTAKKFKMNRRRVKRIVIEAGVDRSDDQVDVEMRYPDVITGDQWLDEEFTCYECHRVFTRQQYMVAMGRTRMMKKDPWVCSPRCRSKFYTRNSKHKRRQRYGDPRNDGIPLGDLIERDGGICQLCGGKVDLDDGFFDQDKRFHTGSKYPTVDHIIPLSKGGANTWDNVQLAHLSCNGGKCNRLPESA